MFQARQVIRLVYMCVRVSILPLCDFLFDFGIFGFHFIFETKVTISGINILNTIPLSMMAMQTRMQCLVFFLSPQPFLVRFGIPCLRQDTQI